MISKTAMCLPRHRDRRGEAGFSLIELSVVLVLLGLIVAVGMPALQDWLERYRVRTAAQLLASDMQLQRMRAVSRNTVHTIVFDAANGNYTLWGNIRSDPRRITASSIPPGSSNDRYS